MNANGIAAGNKAVQRGRLPEVAAELTPVITQCTQTAEAENGTVFYETKQMGLRALTGRCRGHSFADGRYGGRPDPAEA